MLSTTTAACEACCASTNAVIVSGRMSGNHTCSPRAARRLSEHLTRSLHRMRSSKLLFLNNDLRVFDQWLDKFATIADKSDHRFDASTMGCIDHPANEGVFKYLMCHFGLDDFMRVPAPAARIRAEASIDPFRSFVIFASIATMVPLRRPCCKKDHGY